MKNRIILAAAVAMLSCGYRSAQEVSYKINATGQSVCYDGEGNVIDTPKVGAKLYGQDGNYLSGEPMSFVDNGDGTVTDLNTGLTWQQTPPIEGMTWAQAKEYCENLEMGGHSDWRLPTLKELFSISNFAQGWPYIDSEYFNLAGDAISKDQQYWADNKYVGETAQGRNDAAFGVNHVTGHIKAYPAGSNRGNRDGDSNAERPQRSQSGQGGDQRPPMRGEQGGDQRPSRQGEQGGGQRPSRQGEQGGDQRPSMQGEQGGGQRPSRQGEQGGDQRPSMQGEQGGGQRPSRQGGQGGQGGRPAGNPMAKQVRAVRGEPYGENKFVDNGDGTISDLATGLMWAKDDNGKGIEWVDALPYAEQATLAGYSDWRLPNVKELQSIVDYSRSPTGEKFEAAIDPIFECTPFVNEAGDDDFGYYWTGTSACFTKGRPFQFAWYVAFGRAVNKEGQDYHGAGAVRFDIKSNNDIEIEGDEERGFNFVRLVRAISAK